MKYRVALALAVSSFLAGPAPALASNVATTGTPTSLTSTSPTATTGDATSITSTSADLHGVADSPSSDSAFAFEYGTSATYGTVSAAHAIGSGLTAVSMTINDLKPGTTYHYRLDVMAGSYPQQFAPGDDRTFTTMPASAGGFGTASLTSRRLKVSKGLITMPFRCTGAQGLLCAGKVSISSSGRFGTRTRTVGCGTARLSLSAGDSIKLHARIKRGCATLLHLASHHRLKATLQATFSTHQARLRTRVTLILVRRR